MRKMARLLALLLVCALARAEILTPPYVNLALGKKITATATCGDEGPELYCKLVGANADHDEHVIQGQVMFCCYACALIKCQYRGCLQTVPQEMTSETLASSK